MGTVNKPDIIRQTIVINDDYIRKNRRADGGQVMDTMSKESKLKFGQFMVDVKSDIKKHIDNQIIMSKTSQNSM